MEITSEISEKIRLGTIEDLVIYAKEFLGLFKQNLMMWRIVDNLDVITSQYDGKFVGPVIYLTNGERDNQAVIYLDYSKKGPRHNNYILARCIIIDNDINLQQLRINHLQFYPNHDNS